MRIPVEKKKDDLDGWLNQLQKQVSELKPDNEEVQTKLKELQASLEQAIRNQAKQQSQQIQCQKQIALLRGQIETASDAKNIQPLAEKLKTFEADLTQLKSNLSTDIITHLKTLQDEYLSFKKSTEQVVKFNSSLRAQLQSTIEESARQADQFTRWQNEFTEQLAQQNKQQDAALSELQTQLSQTKTALSKRLAALEGRVGDLEVKHTALEVKHDAFVAKTDPAYTVVQKLLKLRQIVLEDKYISDELKYYVAPNGESQPGLGDHEALHEWTQKNLLDAKADARVLLLQGQGGAGKSTFNRFLLRELWQDKAWENFKPGQPMPNAYIPIFIPLGSAQVDPNKLFNYFLDLPELVEGFTESEINVLKKDFRLLLIADGYDEIPGARHRTPNLYDDNQLHKYEGRIKLIISCRSQRSQELNETTYFVPHEHGKPQDSFYKRRSVSSFDDKQMASYIEKYLAKNKTRTDITLWPDVGTYQKHIEAMPDLRKLIDTPFLLMITVEVLPQIVAEVEKASKTSKESKMADTNQLTRAKLYDRFVANWFERQAKKALEASELPEQGDIKRFYQQFCLKLAECFRTAQITSIQYPWEEEIDLFAEAKEDKNDPKGPRGAWVRQLFGDKNSQIASARKGAPLRVGAKNYHQFIHASLIDYFLTTAIHQQTKTREAVVETEVKNTKVQEPVSTTTHVAAPPAKASPLRIPVTTPTQPKISIPNPALPTPIIQKPIEPIFHPVPKPSVKKPEIVLPEVTISSAETLLLQQKLSHEQVYFLADRVIEDEAFKKYLFSLIERSKKEADIAIASANAITVLNAARTSFSGMNFKGIRIPGADLSQAVLDSVQLEGADLSQVTLTGAWLRQVNFSRSKMSGVQWGEWPLLTLPNEAKACAYSPNGRWLAVGCQDNKIYLYDAKQRDLQHTLKGHSHCVRSVIFDAKSERLASGSEDKTVCLWQVTTGRLERRLKGHTLAVNSVAFDARGERLASGSDDRTVRLWQVSTGKLERTLEGHTGSVASVVFDARGELLASAGSRDKTVRLWQVTTGRLERTLEGHADYVVSVAFDARGERLASGSYDKTVRLWQVATGRLEYTLGGGGEGHMLGINSVAFDTKGERLASGSWDNTVRLWQVSTGRLECTLEGHKDVVHSIAFDTKGECLVSASRDKTVRAWQVTTGRLKRMLEGHTADVSSVAIDAKGKRLASGSDDKTVCLWQVTTGRLERTLKGHTHYVSRVAFDAKGKRLVSGGMDNTVRLWQVATGQLERTLTWKTEIGPFALDASGECLAYGINNKVRLRQLTTQSEREFDGFGHIGPVWDVVFDARGRRLASGGRDNTVRLWEVATGQLERKFEGHSLGVSTIAFDTKGECLASGSGDGTIRLWQVATGRLEHMLMGHKAWVRKVAFDVSGDRLASGSKDNTVRLWQVATGTCLAVIQGFNGPVNSVAWQTTLSGSFLATGSGDKTVRYWQVDEVESEKEKVRVTLRWTSHQATLTAIDACIDGAIDLDTIGRDLLQQRGAKGIPAEAKEDVATILSPTKKDPVDIRGLAGPAARLGLLAAPAASPISTSVTVVEKAIAVPKTL